MMLCLKKAHEDLLFSSYALQSIPSEFPCSVQEVFRDIRSVLNLARSSKHRVGEEDRRSCPLMMLAASLGALYRDSSQANKSHIEIPLDAETINAAKLSWSQTTPIPPTAPPSSVLAMLMHSFPSLHIAIRYLAHQCHSVVDGLLEPLTDEKQPTVPVWGSLACSSVVRIWEYRDGAMCREHGDPGLVTALLCGSAPGLEVWNPQQQQWVAIDPCPHISLLLVGQQMATITASTFSFANHRVVALSEDTRLGSASEPRVNLIVEFRPQKPLWKYRCPDSPDGFLEALRTHKEQKWNGT